MEKEIWAQRKRVLGFMVGLCFFVLLFVGASYLISVVMTNYFSELTGEERPIPVVSEVSRGPVVIDPGHGGEDGGSTSGEVLEKDLNLAVSKNVHDILSFIGVPSIMTREEDTALYDLYDDLDDYTGKMKVYDLKNRVRFVNENSASVYVGIHMNKFPDPKYGGLQVYYSPNNDASSSLASTIREDVRKYLQPDNERETKKATSSIFVLDRLEVPAVLVECGFLSNPDDLSALCDPGYRLRLSAVIATAIAEGGASGGY